MRPKREKARWTSGRRPAMDWTGVSSNEPVIQPLDENPDAQRDVCRVETPGSDLPVVLANDASTVVCGVESQAVQTHHGTKKRHVVKSYSVCDYGDKLTWSLVERPPNQTKHKPLHSIDLRHLSSFME